ncbi:MAG: response regulator transcription factor [Fimbriimonadaceae bacterium]
MKEIPIEDAQNLSSRQNEVITLAAHGFTDIAMAHKLGISEGTVGTHWSRIRAKMGPYSRTELVAKGLRSDLQRKLDAVELERDTLVADLQRTHRELLLCRSALNLVADGIVAVTAEGRIECANPAVSNLFGYEERCLKGRELVKLVPERLRETFAKRFAECLKDASAKQPGEAFEMPGLCRGGAEIALSVTLSAVQHSDGALVVAVFQPVVA